jgi:hypothetical protein
MFSPLLVHRRALEAADARIHAQNAALVEQEASLRAANQLLAQLAGKFAAARYTEHKKAATYRTGIFDLSDKLKLLLTPTYKPVPVF